MSTKVEFPRSSYRSLLWLLAKIMKTSPFLTLGWGVLVLLNAGIGAAELLVIREAVNTLVEVDTLTPVIPWLSVLCVFFFTQQVISTLLPLLREKIRISAGYALQRSALQKTGDLPLKAFDVEQSHNLISRVIAGGDSQAIRLMQDALNFIESVPILITSAVVLGIISVWIPVLIIAGTLILRFIEIQLGSRQRHFEVEQTHNKRLAEYYTRLLTERSSAAEIRLWGISEVLMKRWREMLSEYLSSRLRLIFQNTYQGVVACFVFTLTVSLALLIAALSSGGMEAGLAALVLKALWTIGTGMNAIQYYVIGFVQHAGYGADLQHLLKSFQDEPASDSDGRIYPHPTRKAILLEDVSYRYPGAKTDALRGVNLEIRCGEIIAVVGENGAGKTTFAHILAGLRRPTSGQMTINGIDASTIALPEIQRACTMVFQRPLRYPDILRENLAFNSDEISDLECESVLGQVRLSGDTFNLEGLLGPEFGGVDLSGGEWQRLAIARCLLKKDAELLIFDEPTAALDPLAELELFEHFVHLVDGKSAILIAHRLGPTRLADRVVVLDNGRIAEVGKPTELLHKQGKYAGMFAAQSEWYQ